MKMVMKISIGRGRGRKPQIRVSTNTRPPGVEELRSARHAILEILSYNFATKTLENKQNHTNTHKQIHDEKGNINKKKKKKKKMESADEGGNYLPIRFLEKRERERERENNRSGERLGESVWLAVLTKLVELKDVEPIN